MGGLVVFLIVAFIFTFVVQWVRTGSLRGRIEALEREIVLLKREIALLKKGEYAAPEIWIAPAETTAVESPRDDAPLAEHSLSADVAATADRAAETALAGRRTGPPPEQQSRRLCCGI